jgi:hypothetical protein
VFARFEIFTAVGIEFVVFWVCCPEDGGSTVLRNVDIKIATLHGVTTQKTTISV